MSLRNMYFLRLFFFHLCINAFKVALRGMKYLKQYFFFYKLEKNMKGKELTRTNG